MNGHDGCGYCVVVLRSVAAVLKSAVVMLVGRYPWTWHPRRFQRTLAGLETTSIAVAAAVAVQRCVVVLL